MRKLTSVSLALMCTVMASCGGPTTGAETAWCNERLDADMMTRALKGQTPENVSREALEHCVLVPAGTAISVADEVENDFGQIYVEATIVRPDTGKEERLWARKDLAGLK